jgi:hypothetical protein
MVTSGPAKLRQQLLAARRPILPGVVDTKRLLETSWRRDDRLAHGGCPQTHLGWRLDVPTVWIIVRMKV